ncbi:MAG: FGGY-family carbohydrate kinase [Mycobacteriales bacterium]
MPDRGDFLLGIDAGGTLVKALLVDGEGYAVAAGSASRPASTPHPGWAERSMPEVQEVAGTAVRRCLSGAGVGPSAIAAIGIVGHNDGAYLLDASLRPVRPAILASDTRTESLLDRWRRDGRLTAALPIIGQQPFAASPIALLAWLSEHEPAVLDRAAHLLFCKDWIRLGLTGEVATDPTEASASFTSVDSALRGPAAYDDRILELYGVADLGRLQPPILASTAVAGVVSERAAAATGLRAGTPVITGCHDVDAAAVGVGAIEPGVLSLVAGTFAINQVVSTDLHLDGRWQARAFAVPGRLLNMSTSPASASALDWFVRRFVGGTDEPDFGFVDDEVGQVAEDPDVPLFLPYLFGTPLLPHAEAGFIGLHGRHTRAHLLRAVLEGVVCNHRLHVDALRSAFDLAPVARATGGGMRSARWRQLFADGLGIGIEVTDTDEAGARGAAVLAGVGIGVYAGLEDAITRTVRIRHVHEPDPARRARFETTYARFQDVATRVHGDRPR